MEQMFERFWDGLLTVSAFSVFLTARLFPLWPIRHRGCDAYYFLLCSRSLREHWRLPILLREKYLAELQEQWYPPLFPAFLSLLPPEWLRRRHWVVNHLLDFAIAAGLLVIGRSYVGDLGAVAMTLVYAAQPALVQEYSALTSRPLGVLLQLTTIIAGFICIDDNSQSAGALAIGMLALLIYAHKLSLQLLWFLCPFLALTMRAWEWVLFLAAGYAIAGVAWPSFFFKIQRAHFDIVRFWARNWSLLGAHAVRQSPLYGDGKTNSSYYDSSMTRSVPSFLKFVLQINTFAVFLPLGLVAPLQSTPFVDFLWWWAVGVYFCVGATHFIYPLRCFGPAQQYVKYGYVPVLLFAAIYMLEMNTFWAWLVGAACATILLRGYILTVISLRKKRAVPHSARIDEIIRHIETQAAPRILVFPYHFADEIAYRTKAQVLWGTHGYGFRQVEPFFPVLRISLDDLIDAFRLTHVIIDSDYVKPYELNLDESVEHSRIGRFFVFNANSILRRRHTLRAKK
jgi:hypothetical protein